MFFWIVIALELLHQQYQLRAVGCPSNRFADRASVLIYGAGHALVHVLGTSRVICLNRSSGGDVVDPCANWLSLQLQVLESKSSTVFKVRRIFLVVSVASRVVHHRIVVGIPGWFSTVLQQHPHKDIEVVQVVVDGLLRHRIAKVTSSR